MEIDLTGLLKAVGNELDIEEQESASYPEDNLILTQPVKIKAHLISTGLSVLLKGVIESEVQVECSRCLKGFKMPLSVKIEEEYSKSNPVPKGDKKEVELKEKDFVFTIGQDNILDLAETIRQNLLLALPIKLLCRPDCPGLKKE